MAVSYRSADPLRMLNQLLMQKRNETQSDKELALTALTFKIKAQEAEKNRIMGESRNWEKNILDLQKTLDEKKQLVASLGGTFKEVKGEGDKSGLSTDASAVVYLTMSRVAGDVKDLNDAIGKAKVEYGAMNQKLSDLNKSIADYHVGLGKAAADVFRQYGGDAKVDEGEYKQAIEKLKTDSGISDWGSFETGLNKGLMELSSEAEKNKTERAKQSYYRTPKATTADKKLADYDSLYNDWASIQNFIRTGDKSNLSPAEAALFGESTKEKIDPETLYKPFRRRIKLYENKYGEKIMEDFFPAEQPKGEYNLSEMSVDDLMKAYLNEGSNATK